MIRVVLEAIVTITLLLVARAIISSILQAITKKASKKAAKKQQPDSFRTQERTATSGTLHRDPVCGTFVAETTPFRREMAGSRFYYCSQACQETHSLVSPHLNRQDTASPKARRANP